MKLYSKEKIQSICIYKGTRITLISDFSFVIRNVVVSTAFRIEEKAYITYNFVSSNSDMRE